ncbi:ABC transporter permease [Desulforhabdus sp. TSK]|uniref:ABC transporter permease n=1 Tax=Desulforhabdus sp. TSK TaxID=2925014 RepID=UPI001FC8B878|nr:ABC transporter permease [Desulforhabdus sp. TSK]GKT10259.1 ABC transporter permease [Desulforhabdus sp. TSK]
MREKSETLKGIAVELCMSLGVVLAFTTAVLLLAKAPPLQGYRYLLEGSLGSWTKIAQVLTVWVPLTLCACGLQYTFRIGLWNIGVEGQVFMGAMGATAALRWGVGSEFPLLWLVLSALAGALSGGVWALLAGLLKSKGGVNEIFGGLGLNFVAQSISLWLIFGPWKRPGIASMSGTEPFPPELWLPSLEGWRVSPHALLFTVAVILGTGRLLQSTRIGLALKAVGGNVRAAPLFGLHAGRWMLLAMVLGGGLAGLAGTFQVTGVYHRLIPSISSQYGYLALLVVMLANYRLLWIPFIAFFFAALNVGSIQLPMMLQVDSSLSGVIQGALVLATLLVHGWREKAAERRDAETARRAGGERHA